MNHRKYIFSLRKRFKWETYHYLQMRLLGLSKHESQKNPGVYKEFSVTNWVTFLGKVCRWLNNDAKKIRTTATTKSKSR